MKVIPDWKILWNKSKGVHGSRQSQGYRAALHDLSNYAWYVTKRYFFAPTGLWGRRSSANIVMSLVCIFINTHFNEITHNTSQRYYITDSSLRGEESGARGGKTQPSLPVREV